jgi:hypothetical protein
MNPAPTSGPVDGSAEESSALPPAGSEQMITIALYESKTDTTPAAKTVSGAELVGLLQTFRTGEKDGPAWSPVRIGSRRRNEDVQAVTVAVFDLDGCTSHGFAKCKSLIDEAGIAAVWHSTFSHAPGRPSLRLVLFVSRDIAPSEWPTVRQAMIERFAIPADPATKDLARLYYWPTAQEGVKGYASSREGQPIDVDALLSCAVQIPDSPSHEPKPQSDVSQAVARFNDEHPGDWPRPGTGTCPVCGHRECFGRFPSNDQRWACFSAGHCDVGLKGETCWHGDALDLEAHKAGVDRVTLLRDSGYLVDRPTIRLTVREHQANAEACKALAKHPDVYGRDGQLVRIEEGPPARAVPLVHAEIRSMLTEVATFERLRKDEVVTCSPSEPLVQFVLAAGGRDPEIRKVELITESMLLRDDFSIAPAGYDQVTRAYSAPTCTIPRVAEKPTRADALAALEFVREPFRDMPFETAADEAACLALTATQPVRAIVDVMPGGLIDASTAGVGKTKTADVIALIWTGRPAERVTFPAGDEAEQRKQITSILRAVKALNLWDNTASGGMFGGAPVDQLITAPIWEDRSLGLNRTLRLENKTQFLATGNNVSTTEDGQRRWVRVRMVATTSNPEDRGGFRHPDLLGWVRENRGRLIAAWLTIFRAYAAAGCPRQGLKPFGSFELWSAYVREPLTWLGLPDPIQRMQEFASISDTQGTALERLVVGLSRLLRDNALSAGEILETLQREWGQHEDLKAALLDLCPSKSGELPTTASLGRQLAKFRQRRTADGRFIDSRIDRHTKNARWRVVAVDAVDAVDLSGAMGEK